METDFFDLTYASASTYHPHPCTTAQQPRRYNLRSTLSFYSGLRPLFTHIGCEIILSCWYPRSGGKGGQWDITWRWKRLHSLLPGRRFFWSDVREQIIPSWGDHPRAVGWGVDHLRSTLFFYISKRPLFSM